MAEALITGLLRQKTLSSRSLYVCDIRKTRLTHLKRKFRVQTTPSLETVLAKSDIIILAVKPQVIQGVLKDLRPHVTQKHLMISIAAGIDTGLLKKHLGSRSKIVRAMPNTPALVGKGVTGLFVTSKVSSRDSKIVQQIFEAVGLVIKLPKESDLDIITALSGSGPAFVFHFIESLILAAQKLGFPASRAQEIVVATFEGAIHLLKHTQESPQSLRKKVTSKGGTTEAGLKQMKKDHIQQGYIRMIHAATRRARSLKREYK